MKSTSTTLPQMYGKIFAKMYTDCMAIGWSMFLGKPPEGSAMESKLKTSQAETENGRANQPVSVEPAKKARAKAAARKAQAKPAAKKAQAKPAAKKARGKPAAKKARRTTPAKKRPASGKRS